MLSTIVRGAVRVLLLLAICFGAPAQGQSIRVTLLGTGSPTPAMNRFGPSTLVEIGDQKFLFDAGRGALQRLAQTPVQWRDVQGIFITHLHSDHLVGLPDLWLTGAFLLPGRRAPLRIWGPTGTKAMMTHLKEAFDDDLRSRQVDSRLSSDAVAFLADDMAEGTVYEKDGVKITAFEVDHKPLKAFGFRIDHGGHSVVLSGDTTVSENLIRHAQSADVLVHEVVSPDALSRMGLPAARIAQILGQHVSPEQAGEVFSKVKPRLAVYSHLIPPQAAASDLIAPTRKAYTGRVEVGEDLMVIEVGQTIEVHKASHPVPGS
jgi:ribonuclease Z